MTFQKNNCHFAVICIVLVRHTLNTLCMWLLRSYPYFVSPAGLLDLSNNLLTGTIPSTLGATSLEVIIYFVDVGRNVCG